MSVFDMPPLKLGRVLHPRKDDDLLAEMLPDITARYHQNAPESVAANPGAQHKARMIKTILRALSALGGATSEEIETALGLSHQSVSARFSDLKRLGLIVQTGQRLTRSERLAGVWSPK